MSESEVPSPIEEVARLLDEAHKHEDLAEAASIATVGADGAPSLRLVLVKAIGPAGIVFYTNADSRKGRDLAENPRAALAFHWKSLGRQVRVEGAVDFVTDAEADAYFASRARESQLGAWASPQSQPLSSHAELERRFAEMEKRFTGVAVPRPTNWRGYRIVPSIVEFWSERPHRLHDRTLYRKDGDGWHVEHLYP